MFYVKNYTPAPRINLESFMKDAEKFLNDPYAKEQAPKYPLTNIGYCGTTLVFELALAGFKKENVSVSYVGNVVTVKAVYEKKKSDDSCNCACTTSEIKYIQKNISNKDVCRKFYLANEYLGSSIKWKFVNGLLTIAVYPNNGDESQIDPSEDDEDIYGSKCSCECCKPEEIPPSDNVDLESDSNTN